MASNMFATEYTYKYIIYSLCHCLITRKPKIAGLIGELNYPANNQWCVHTNMHALHTSPAQGNWDTLHRKQI